MRRTAICIALLAALLAGCGGSTGEARTRFALRVAPASDLGAIQNEHGFTVALSKAVISLGALTFYAGAPLVTSDSVPTAAAPRRRAARTLLSRVARAVRWLWPVSTAHAHPGHYSEGGALAELRVDRTIDLLADEPARVGEAAGVTGDYRSLAVDIGTISIVGTASKAGQQPIRFAATLHVDKAVLGAPVAAGFDPAPGGAHSGAAELQIDAAQWVSRIDFARLSQTDALQTFADDSQAYNALSRGAYNAAAFTAVWTN
ncbi:MAG: hypothetical protein KC503_37470 [Myxococcales bacterium]|nr:hypothetical protein [Myxococcales bacterium]